MGALSGFCSSTGNPDIPSSASPSSSQASASSSAKLPSPLSVESPYSFEKLKSPFLEWDDGGRGVVGVRIDCIEDFRLRVGLEGVKELVWGLEEGKVRLKLEDGRRRWSVVGDCGIMFPPIQRLNPWQL
jgi:hypothetical protein